MKIIIRNKDGLKRCYVQLRDIIYIGERYQSPYFFNYANKERKKGIDLDGFVNLGNSSIAELFIKYPYVVDFSEMINQDSTALSRMIVLSHSFMDTDSKYKDDVDHKIADIVDIINFKNGTLSYPIPVLFNEDYLVNDGEVIFGSTTLPGYYKLRANNKDVNLIEYLSMKSRELFEQVVPGETMVSYDYLEVGDDLLVKFHSKKKLFSGLRKKNN